MKLLTKVFIFFLPLVFVGGTSEFYEFPKTLFIYILGAMAFVLLAIKSFDFVKLIPKVLWLFLASYLLSTLLSSHLYTSVWGYYSRFFGGLSSIVCVIFLGAALKTAHKTKEEFLDLILFSTYSIIPVSFLGILQYLGGVGVAPVQRVYSTFGQPNWLAQYLAMQLLVVLMFLYKKPTKFLLALYSVGFACFWLAFSISGLLGFFIGLVAVVVINKQKPNAYVMAAGVLSVVFALLNSGFFFARLSDTKTDITRIVADAPASSQESAKYSYKVSDPGIIRWSLWQGTLTQSISSAKVFFVGTGPETFPYEFQKFRPADLNYSSEWDFVFNKPHNYYLEVFSEKGVFGLVAFVLLLVYTFLKTPVLLKPAVLGFAVTNFFGWPTATVLALFLIWSLWSETSSVDAKRDSNFFGLVGVAVAVVFLWRISLFYSADRYFVKSQELSAKGNFVGALTKISTGLDQNPNEPAYYRERAKVNLLLSAQNNLAVKQVVLNDLKKAVELNPDNLVIKRNLVPLYYFLCLDNLTAAVSAPPILDKEYCMYTQEFYAALKQDYARDAGVLVLLVEYEWKLGWMGDARETLALIKALRPDLLEWHPALLKLHFTVT